MDNPAAALEKVLAREKELYDSVCTLEMGKREAILARDGKLLERLSLEQELLIHEIHEMEKKRHRMVEEFKRSHRLTDGRPVTLSDVVKSLDKDNAARLVRLGADLKELLLRIKEVQELNREMLGDIMEFYRILVTSLKSGVSFDAGYGKNGREEGRNAKSILFNQTA